MSSEYEQHQQQLLATLIKWTNAIILVGVVINSYWFLSDFWGTLLQNAGVLVLVGIGLWCLRLSRQGQIRLAARIYVGSGMLLVALVILALGPQSILNGAMTLALFVLIATFLESPELALRWGVAAAALYALAITARIFGPIGDVPIDSVDVVSLYAFPVLILVGLAILGRGAAIRLSEALDRSEAARGELADSYQALQETQIALEAANDQLQLELVERRRAEGAVRTSLEEIARDQRLLLGLSRTAQAVQLARTPEEVYRTIGDEIKELGYDVIVLRPSEDEEFLEIAYVSFSPAQLARIDEVFGFPVLEHRIRRAPGSIVQQVLEQGEAMLVDRYADYLAEAFPASTRPLIGRLIAVTGMEQSITAPLTVDGQAYGLVIITGLHLTEADRQAMSALASQAAIALSNVRLYQETQNWAAQLERRVEERTAELAASEGRYQRLFDSSRDGLLVVDMQGRCLDANPALCALLGYSREELLTMDAFQVGWKRRDLPSDEGGQGPGQTRPAWCQGQPQYEMELIRKTGERVPVEVSANSVIFRGREAAMGAVRDATERKRTEQALRRSREEALQSHRRLLALSQSAQAVQQARTPHEIYQTIGDEITRLGFQAIIFSLTADRSQLTFAHLTFESALLRAAEKVAGLATATARVRLALDEPLRRVVEDGEAVFFERTADRIAWGVPVLGRGVIERLVTMLDIEKSIYAPLKVGGEVCGLLLVAGTDLEESDVPAVAVFANQAGIALENARLLEEQQANRARMQHLARQVVSAQEEERRRLAHALHDEAGQALTALEISLELTAQDVPPELGPIRNRIASAAAVARATMDQIRHLAQDLRPPALDAVGLNVTLEGFCHDFAQRTRLAIDYRGQELPHLAEPVNITLYRFLQEALTNVARHARAKRVLVTLHHDAESISLTVDDDGQGFEQQAGPSHPGRRGGIGLDGMRQRLESLDGRLEVETQPGQGTRLVAYIPL